MTQISNSKHYDLEDRCLVFAKRVIRYINQLPKNIVNLEITRQLVRSSGSIGANYIEANESLGRKDFVMKIRISKKEAKESRHWLNLTEPNQPLLDEKQKLIQESNELMKIFGSIAEKSK